MSPPPPPAHPSSLPTSPATRAFFAALDNGGGQSSSTSKSSFVQKKIATLGWRNRHSQDEWYPVTVAGRSFSVHQVQRGEVEGTYGTGATVWPAALVLIKYLEKHPELVRYCRGVLDLGAGTGVTSVAAAILGARQVVCTDGDDAVVDLARHNVQHALQQLTPVATTTPGQAIDAAAVSPTSFLLDDCVIHVGRYCWSGTEYALHTDADGCDVILVADCVLPKLYPMAPLVDTIAHHLRRAHEQRRQQQQHYDDVNTVTPLAVLSYEYRYYEQYDPRTHFIELATQHGLVVEIVPLPEQDEVYSVDDIEIWKVYFPTTAL